MCSVFTVVANNLVQITTVFLKHIAAHPDEGLIQCHDSTAVIMYQHVKVHLYGKLMNAKCRFISNMHAQL